MKRSTIIILSLAILFSSGAETWAADWRTLPSNSSELSFYDMNSLKRDKNIVRVWVKLFLPETEIQEAIARFGDKYKNLKYMITYDEYNCEKDMRRSISATNYAENGRLIFSADFDDPKWKHVIPGSNGELELITVCNLTKPPEKKPKKAP